MGGLKETIRSKLSLQCARAAARANAVLGQISRAVSYRDAKTFLKLYTVYVRPHLEYAVASWSPWEVGDKETLEKVQRRALTMVSNLRGRTYRARLEEVGMLSLEERRVRGDMIATYKIMSGKDKVDPGLLFERGGAGQGPRTRGDARVHSLRPVGARLDIRRFSFSHRVVNRWNSLPNNIKGVETVLAFKIGYDKWMSEGVLGAGAGGQ